MPGVLRERSAEQKATPQVLTNRRYVYTKEMKHYTEHTVKKEYNAFSTKTTETWRWMDYKHVEKFDCELTADEKELIGKIKAAMSRDRYKKEMRELTKTAGRPIKLEGQTVHLSLTGPTRKVVQSEYDKSHHDIRNMILYDIATDRVYGFALLSDKELENFKKARTAFSDSFMGRNRWFFGSPLYMLTLCGLFTGPFIYCCIITPEHERILRGFIETDLDARLVQENCCFGTSYLEVFTHDYTKFGSHDSTAYVINAPTSPNEVSDPMSPPTAPAPSVVSVDSCTVDQSNSTANPLIIAPQLAVPMEMQRE